MELAGRWEGELLVVNIAPKPEAALILMLQSVAYRIQAIQVGWLNRGCYCIGSSMKEGDERDSE